MGSTASQQPVSVSSPAELAQSSPVQPSVESASQIEAQVVTSDVQVADQSVVAPPNPFQLASHVNREASSKPQASDAATPETLADVISSESASSQSQKLAQEASMAEEIPAPTADETSSDAATPDAQSSVDTLSIEDVIMSATESFPAIREASLLRSLAIGNQIAAMGEFDDKLEAYTINQPLGFYENYRHGLGWKNPLIMGGTGYLGYSLGDGDFEPWFGERETNEGGEFKAGFDIPLLQNRAIDPRRTAVRLASLDIQRANPELFQQVLMTQYEAVSAYYVWFAAAKQYSISLELMELAEERVERIEKQIAAGDVAKIVGIDNRRLLAMRRAKLIESRQKLDSAAIKLSLYYRDSMGRPVRPLPETQPKDFPALPMQPIDENAEVVRAMANRPELRIFEIVEEQLRTELRLAINQRLPELSFGTEVSQDVGGLASSKGDKQPFKLETGFIGTVPVQRRKAIGKAQALRAKLGQLDAKRQLTGDKITNEVLQAATVYDAALQRLEQARLNRELAQQTLAAGEISFAAGDIDILLLNIYEQAFADAGVEVINSQADLLTAEALLNVSTGQSLLIDDSVSPLILNSIP